EDIEDVWEWQGPSDDDAVLSYQNNWSACATFGLAGAAAAAVTGGGSLAWGISGCVGAVAYNELPEEP
ncbi:hypothetical protein, partial [Actinophytocola sp.]|uniref:hypothetical protein n=1 Tax=Actinophytocola sp. TaxID=1872138 RepID=UPI002D809D02